MHPLLCAAIRTQQCLRFEYDGRARLVEPYCYGINARGKDVLRAIQVGGVTRSGGYGFGKLWLVSKMQRLSLGDETFVASDPHYNPSDSAMVTIHCCVRAAERTVTTRS